MWARGYFSCSTGNITDSMMKAYIDGHAEQDDNFMSSDFECDEAALRRGLAVGFSRNATYSGKSKPPTSVGDH